MKKFVGFIFIWTVLLSLVYILYSENQTSVTKGKSAEEIHSIIEKYGDRAYKSFYSIEELRPYSIIQIDKISQMYSNKWLSPDLIMKKITSKDKKILAKSIIEYINDMKKNKREYILKKIINWCKADLQFSFINNDLGIYRENILKAVHQVTGTQRIISKYYDLKADDVEKLSPEQMNKAYYETLNLVSSLKWQDQLKYYSDIYNQLAVICK